MTPGLRQRIAISGVLLALALLAGCKGGPSEAQAQPRPARLVKLADGRALNLDCRGNGAPTVILEAGFGANATAWGRVQPALARTTRVCSYDRAGAGFSDPGPLPRDGAAIARDLDQALAAAGIEGPYVLVGHSAGGLYARLFAARRPGEVQGFVLLDPTPERVAPTPGANDGLDGQRRRVRRCLAAATGTGIASPEATEWTGCVARNPDAQAWSVARRPDTWRDQLSELDEIFGRTSQAVLRIGDLMRSVPAYVITASDSANASAKVGYDKTTSLWELAHVQMAGGFEHGWQRTVLSSHLVMIDRPEVVIDAVQAMVQAARAGTPPPPLPPSETAPSGETSPFTPPPAAPK